MTDVVVYATIYPSRPRLLAALATYLGCLAAGVGVEILVIQTDWPFKALNIFVWLLGCIALLLPLIILGPLCLASSVSLIYRLIRWFPSIQVTSQGIVDNCSLLAGGVGLLPWAFISDVFPTSLMPVPTYFAKDRYLLVRLTNPDAADPKTTVLRLFRRIMPLAAKVRRDVVISNYMLSLTPGELIAPIRQAYLIERKLGHIPHKLPTISGLA